jgi:hypothetical protein
MCFSVVVCKDDQYYVNFLDNNLPIPKMGVLHRMTAR